MSLKLSNGVNSRRALIGGALMIALAFGAGLYAGVSERGASAQTISIVGGKPTNADFSQFWAAWSVLDNEFVQTHGSSTLPTDAEKVYGAIKGLTESYGDPYTVFFPPVEAQIFNDNVNGTFSGVGMELGQKDGSITVVAPLKGSPAERAGIRSGDAVIKVDGKSTEGMAVDAAVKIIRGEKGTKVTLTLTRAGVADPIELTITRDTINIPVLETKTAGDVYIISLYSFSPDSPARFREALRQFFISGKTKLILDLRGNPGGYLESAVEMASYFLPVGEVVVTEDTRGHGANSAHRSLGYNVFAGKKLSMAVLINEGSASASEILAGALQQHGIAKLVGERSFGKGSVQQLIDLGGGAELKVTIARWLTPNGSSISDGGLTPDIKAERTDADRTKGLDPQLSAATSWLATQ